MTFSYLNFYGVYGKIFISAFSSFMPTHTCENKDLLVTLFIGCETFSI